MELRIDVLYAIQLLMHDVLLSFIQIDDEETWVHEINDYI